MITYTTNFGFSSNSSQLLTGVAYGGLFSLILLGLEAIFYRVAIRSFNTLTLGLIFGYVMGLALSSIFEQIVLVTSPHLASTYTFHLFHIGIILSSAYLGAIITLKTAEEVYLSIPFVRLKPVTQRKKDIILDASALADPRIIDFANSGLVDNHLILPRFVMEALYKQVDTEEETSKSKARRSLEVVKKLESLHYLHIRFHDTDFPEVKQVHEKIVKLARLLDANILTADMTSLETATLEDIRVINLHSLSNALKPLMHSNEHLMIKIQRYGKEARQGVGYLEDGTMVVVNGGGEFIGKTIKARVLSVKHTSSGRIIFCNANEDFYGSSLGIDDSSYTSGGSMLDGRDHDDYTALAETALSVGSENKEEEYAKNL
ncbi:MAG: yacL [Chlamydiales bacterium]|jgi:uncharacterized protein YacL|nr:yacL [Chlamydiales bacterium]